MMTLIIKDEDYGDDDDKHSVSWYREIELNKNAYIKKSSSRNITVDHFGAK